MSWHKPSLAGVDNLCNIRFEPLHNDSRKQFIKGITKADWSKLSDQVRMSNFWNKHQVCESPIWRYSKLFKNFLRVGVLWGVGVRRRLGFVWVGVEELWSDEWGIVQDVLWLCGCGIKSSFGFLYRVHGLKGWWVLFSARTGVHASSLHAVRVHLTWL